MRSFYHKDTADTEARKLFAFSVRSVSLWCACVAQASAALLALLRYDERRVTLAEQAGFSLRALLARRRRSGSS